VSDDRQIFPPISMDASASVTPLPVKFKEPIDEERYLTVAYTRCHHGPYEVDRTLMEVTCKKCKEKVNPMEVLLDLAHHETRWHDLQKRYQEEMKRLAERSSTKCQHCDKMTRISGR
jgi:hypothetical protein